jgi:hypothetical protein
MATRKITLNELRTLVKKIIKEEIQINEIEKYIPSIDSDEDEEEIKKKSGVIEKDPYKLKDPYKTLKSDDFYDNKIKDTKLKNTIKRVKGVTTYNPDKNIKQTHKPKSDLDYLGNWKKTSDKSQYYDRFKEDVTNINENNIVTKKITINELRILVKKIIKEEVKKK